MILFFVLLLLLATAWGVADHYRDIVSGQPPAPPPVVATVPAPPDLPVVPPAMESADVPGEEAVPMPPEGETAGAKPEEPPASPE